jgi:hypothetical protein
MSQYTCEKCKQPISIGVYKYSINNLNHSLCMTCQDNIRRAREIKEGKFKRSITKYVKCQRCGSAFTKPQDDPYCKPCRKKIDDFKPKNPFSRTNLNSEIFGSSSISSDHYG